jgi:hypothetical protein
MRDVAGCFEDRCWGYGIAPTWFGFTAQLPMPSHADPSRRPCTPPLPFHTFSHQAFYNYFTVQEPNAYRNRSVRNLIAAWEEGKR